MSPESNRFGQDACHRLPQDPLGPSWSVEEMRWDRQDKLDQAAIAKRSTDLDAGPPGVGDLEARVVGTSRVEGARLLAPSGDPQRLADGLALDMAASGRRQPCPGRVSPP